MQQLIKTELFSLLRETTKRTILPYEWEQTYETFAKRVFDVNAILNTRGTYHNLLCYTRAELAYLQGWDGLKK